MFGLMIVTENILCLFLFVCDFYSRFDCDLWIDEMLIIHHYHLHNYYHTGKVTQPAAGLHVTGGTSHTDTSLVGEATHS